MNDYQILIGDCRDHMRDMPENSIDAIVTDPPYGQSFMGKKWDYDVPSVEIWQECLRVLKPGGHLLAFGGTRTYHRMAVAIEDAGFEIRDMLEWVYNCLSEDTEILTVNGWERYHKTIDKYPVLCYDIDNEKFEFHKPLRKFIYENKHTAYRIKSDKTDQLVSRNHRVVVERGGRKMFKQAETLERQEDIPFLESLSDLPETIHDGDKGTSYEKQDLLARVHKQDIDQKTTKANNTSNREEMSYLREVVQNKKGKTGKVLLSQLQWQSKRKGSSSSQSRKSNQMDRGAKTEGTGTNDGREKLGVERRRNLFQEKRELLTDKICEMSQRVFNYGAERRLCYGASVIHGAEAGAMFVENRSRPSHQSQPARQQGRKSDVISKQPGTQTTRSTITPIEYEGRVWCVEVPTGAFVARRNGKIFITGNSGFPKSLSVGKAYDKKMRNKREVIKKAAPPPKDFKKGTFDNRGPHSFGNAEVTKGHSQWEGFGTALKPAHEPIVMARKPLSEKTIVANCIKHGTGALDIDGCRIPTKEEITNHSRGVESAISKGKYGDSKAQETHQTEGQKQGRFPPNLLVTDDALNDGDMTKSGASKNYRNKPNYLNKVYGKGKGGLVTPENQHTDSGSKSRYFDIDVWAEKHGLIQTPKASKKDRDEGLRELREPVSGAGALRDGGRESQPRKNHHATVKPTTLMHYLIRLVTPPEGTVLDPFMGSGSTGKAARLEGVGFIGIELDPDYAEIARARIEAAQSEAEDDASHHE